jgi:transposase
MIDSTSVLCPRKREVPPGLEDEFVVTSVERLASGDLRVVIEHQDREGACPDCRVVASRVRDRPLVRVKDLDASDQRVQLWWRKRRLACREPACPRGSFTLQSEQIPAPTGAPMKDRG